MEDERVYARIVRPDGFLTIDKTSNCWWCRKIIYSYQQLFQKDFYAFCSIDCQDEYRDWSRIRSYKKQLVKQKTEYHKGRVVKKPKDYIPLDRKEYLKEYAIKNKERRRESVKKAMKKYRAKVAKLKANK